MSLFSVAGVSTFKDGTKVRFANDLTRIKILSKNGHTDIELIELPEPMEKPEVVKHLLTTELASNPTYRAALDEANEKYSPMQKAPKTVAVKAPKTVKTAAVTKTKTPAVKATRASAAKVPTKKSETATATVATTPEKSEA